MPSSSFFLTSQDHSYQLAMGQAILNGRLPGIDFFTLYGPMVAYASALGKLLTGNLLGEIFICAIGYSAALAFAFHSLRRISGILSGLLFLLAAVILLPRFYKWYFWFFPLTNYLLFTLVAFSEKCAAKHFFLWGVFGGFSLLFRPDMGLTSLFFAQICTLAASRGNYYVKARAYLNGYVLFPLGYLALVLVAGGLNALSLYARTTFFSIWDIITTYSGLSSVNGRLHMLYHTSMLLFLGICLPTYALAMAWAWRRRHSEKEGKFALSLFGLAVLGLCMFTQAYRPDIQHIQQMIPCYLMLVGLLAGRAVQRLRAGNRPELAHALPLLLALACVPVFLNAKSDLAGWSRNWMLEFKIIQALPNSRPDSAIATIAEHLSRLTEPGESVFITSPRTPGTLLYLSGNHLPGLFPVYAPGLLDGKRWWTLNEREIEVSGMRYLVVDLTDWESTPPDKLAPFIPDLVTRWRNEYTHKIFTSNNLAIMGRQTPR
jgi:hypothetical protein